MSSRRWRQIQDFSEAAAERPPAEREAFLDQACGSDANLRAVVDSLLAADAEDHSLLNLAGVGEAARALLSAEGQRIGPYRIVRKLGEGGVGAVYLAERDDGQFEQTVALKLLRTTLASERVLYPVQALAVLYTEIGEFDAAALKLFLTEGGVFNQAKPAPAAPPAIGTMNTVWFSCERAALVYDLDTPRLSGRIPLRRVVRNNSDLCKTLATNPEN